MKHRVCARCGKPIKRGEEWMEAVGIRIHMSCIRKAAKEKRAKAENADDREKHGKTSRGDSHSDAIKRGIRKSTNKYWRHAR